jgi:Mn2+/Fe2+ NRAMP family transporter
MMAVQMACAQIGMASGEGLASALRKKTSRKVVAVAAAALFLANTINISADLAGMAEAGSLLVGVRPLIFVIAFAVAITWATIRLRYEQIARVLKWMAVSLFAYVITAIHVVPQWGPVLRDALVPRWPVSRNAWALLVAIFGTTISPYLFFWQASLEVEEEKAAGNRRVAQRRGTTPAALRWRWLDVGVGTLFSNVVMFFVIVSTAYTLHRHGVTHPNSSADIARALEPLAGRFAKILYASGLVGVGLLAIPTLSGSAAYAFAETFGWKQGLDERFRRARAFYTVIVVSTVLAVALDLARISAVSAMYWSAVVNGLLAPPLMLGILLIASDGKLMHRSPIGRAHRVVLAAAGLVMAVAAIGMFLF